MKCINCENQKYCDLIKQRPNMAGCTSGETQYLPQIVAKNFLKTIKKTSSILNIEYDEYYNLILNEIIEQKNKE